MPIVIVFGLNLVFSQYKINSVVIAPDVVDQKRFVKKQQQENNAEVTRTELLLELNC